MKFEERLVCARKTCALSQEGLAELVGVSRQAVSKWENGEAQPDYTKLVTLADALEVSLDWLCGREETKPEEKETPPVKRSRGGWIVLAALCAAVLLLGLGFGFGLFTGMSTAVSHTEEKTTEEHTVPVEVPALPDVFEVSGVKLSYRPADGVFHYQFCPNVAGEGYTYRLSFIDSDGRARVSEAEYSGGICSGTVYVGKGAGFGWTAVAIIGNGEESRQVTIAKNIDWNESSSGWQAAE